MRDAGRRLPGRRPDDGGLPGQRSWPALSGMVAAAPGILPDRDRPRWTAWCGASTEEDGADHGVAAAVE
jgi:hypothetical protein